MRAKLCDRPRPRWRRRPRRPGPWLGRRPGRRAQPRRHRGLRARPAGRDAGRNCRPRLPPTPSSSSTARISTVGLREGQFARQVDRRRRHPDRQQGRGVTSKPSGASKNYQLHVEWRIPENITGTDQARGNSGVFLASTGPGDAGYELQVLDSYNNKTYVNGQAGSIYKQGIPLANPTASPASGRPTTSSGPRPPSTTTAR